MTEYAEWITSGDFDPRLVAFVADNGGCKVEQVAEAIGLRVDETVYLMKRLIEAGRLTYNRVMEGYYLTGLQRMRYERD